MGFGAVLFDWRGTLVTGVSAEYRIRRAFDCAGYRLSAAEIRNVLDSIEDANGVENRLGVAGIDSDAELHRRTHFSVFSEAGLPPSVAEALYSLDSDPLNNRFAVDVAPTLRRLRGDGRRIAVVSDIHFDVRGTHGGRSQCP